MYETGEFVRNKQCFYEDSRSHARKDKPFIEIRLPENGLPTQRIRPTVPAWLEEVGKDYAAGGPRINDTFPLNLQVEQNQIAHGSVPTGHPSSRASLATAQHEAWSERGVLYKGFSAADAPIVGAKKLVLTTKGVQPRLAFPLLRCIQHAPHGGKDHDQCDRPVHYTRSTIAPYEWWPTRWCYEHFKFHRAGVTLGKVYNSGLPPELVKHVTSILADPDGMAAREELAMAKALGALMLRKFSEAEGGMDAKMAATAINVMDKITTIADKQAKISDKQDSKLSYKQVLVLISAAVERTLQVVGKSEDARNMLYTILPDLPWPSGVARVHGSEGLVGAKGQLILPQKPAEKKLIIDADFEGLDVKYEPEGKVITEEQRKELQGFPVDPSVFDGALRRAPRIQKDACPPDGFMLYEDPVAPPGVPPEDFDSTGFKVSQLDIL